MLLRTLALSMHLAAGAGNLLTHMHRASELHLQLQCCAQWISLDTTLNFNVTLWALNLGCVSSAADACQVLQDWQAD